MGWVNARERIGKELIVEERSLRENVLNVKVKSECELHNSNLTNAGSAGKICVQ